MMAGWLLTPIVRPLPLPLLSVGAADDPATKAGSAAAYASGGNKRKATTTTSEEVPSRALANPFTIAAAGGMGTKEGGVVNRTAGDYHLPGEPHALLRYEPGAMQCSEEQYRELWRFGEERVPASPNPLNRHTNLRRKQATFGAVYKFGAQVSMVGGGGWGGVGGGRVPYTAGVWCGIPTTLVVEP